MNMKKNIPSYKKLLLIIMAIGSVHIFHANQKVETFNDYQNRIIELRQVTDEQLFAQAAPIFVTSLLKAYEHASDEDLKLVKPLTLPERISTYFWQEEHAPFCAKKFFVVGAFFENSLIGYISFDKPTASGELYIRQLVVDTRYWQNGIGRKLVFSVLKLFPHTTSLALVTRRINECARTFYKHLAFDECPDYVHAPWDPEDFIGYKKVVTENDCANAQAISQKLDAYMATLTKLSRFSGSVLVAKGNTILLNKGYGLASREFEIPNTAQTKFKILSVTKMVTAAAIMLLQEQGLLQVNDPISRYLPDYPRGNEITIHQLLSHTSGVSTCNMPLEMVVCPATIEQMTTFYANKSLEFEPGADYHYSNAGYYILSSIIEKISGKTYEAYIKDNIVKPLKMNDSFFRDHDYAILKNCATGYCANETNTLVNGHYVYENFRGGGGLICTAHDLYIFAKALNTGALINHDSLKAMFTPYHAQENYGYGCQTNHLMNHPCIEHAGVLSSGFKSNLSIFTHDEIYIVILSNLFHSWVNDARDSLAAIMLDVPYDMPSCDAIKVDPATYNDYIGIYDHPDFKSNYTITKKGNALYLPQNIQISPVAVDQFMALHQNADNIVYTFIRDEKGRVVQLTIKGGCPYFEVRCKKE